MRTSRKGSGAFLASGTPGAITFPSGIPTPRPEVGLWAERAKYYMEYYGGETSIAPIPADPVS